ncbi:serine hydrolase domain-containing protein [Mucilaginibacter dorajii]|uniref:Beta-lactamase-related domain-containing protein n=1 Tax=Mucilaginibacter dorajii TaxID=692994 RepID=A0ABP7P6E6_9SPHI|nr:serine hydrolase domain-containing protein [Mucilaginibacter dorajii]MCS3734565.1 CubicO group peptidase (beta-lactamase class C family) [Mucilaginibacter dorajii]
MKKYLFQLPILLLLALTVKPASAQTIVPLSCLDSIPAWMQQHHVPVIAASILEDGKIKQTKSFGNLENGAVASLNTLFNVASLTKPITALTVLKLVDAGKWSLDEPLDKYWIDPDVKDDPRYKKLTTRIVLSHQTGFPNWRSGKLVFMFEPGTKYSYSGEGFEYLRHALEHKFNRTLQQLAYSVLFKPLDMKDTHYGWSKQMDSTRFADPHDKNGALIKMTKNTAIISADWLVTTIGDYSKFAQSVLNQKALSQKLFAQMVTPQVQMEGKPKENMGLGWEVMTPLENGEYLIMHTGSDDGVKTLIILLPQSKRGIILFTNGNNGFDIIIKTIREAFHIKELAQ